MTEINFSPAAARSLDSADVVAGNFTTQTIKSALYLIAFCILIVRWKYTVKLATKNILIWVILLWVFASFVWSEEPSLTLRTAAGLLGTTFIALYLASTYDYRRFALMAAWSFLIVDILSACAIAFFPSLGISWNRMGGREFTLQKWFGDKLTLRNYPVYQPAYRQENSQTRDHWVDLILDPFAWFKIGHVTD